MTVQDSRRQGRGATRRIALCFGLYAALMPVAASAAVVFVAPTGNNANNGLSWTNAKQTVTAGLAAAAGGDQVWVAAGTYVERITLKADVGLYGGLAGDEDPATFDLAARDFAAHETILDGNQGGSVVTGPAGATATCRIDGFTITNGKAARGGGVYLPSSGPTVAHNRISSNAASSSGGGLYVVGSVVTIARNVFCGNAAEGSGGGLYLKSANGTLVDNVIADNTAGFGGGLYLDASAPHVSHNRITGNRAIQLVGGGGGLELYGSSPMITGNVIAGNSGGLAGGLYLRAASAASIVNNTVTGNSGSGLYVSASSPTIISNLIARNVAYSGAGLRINSQSAPTLAGNTIVCNSASSGGALECLASSPTISNSIVAFNSSGIRSDDVSTVLLRHNCVYGNAEYDYSGLSDATGVDGNLSADPQFAAWQYGNFHLQPNSPCVDAGNNVDVAGDFDLDGQPRIQPVDGVVDMGADESDGTVWGAGPYAIVRVRPDGDDSADGSSWPLAKRTVQAAIDAATAVGGDAWVQAGTYYECLQLRPHVFLYGGFMGDESLREERDWAKNVTILDGQQQGSVVSVQSGHRVSAIDGFTIRHGSAAEGGGLYLFGAGSTVTHNVIRDNTASSHGGGLYGYASTALIRGNVVAQNATTGAGPGGEGGGLYLFGSQPAILGNHIVSNHAYSWGGGLFLDHCTATTIDNNAILDNSASYAGGGVVLSVCAVALCNSTIAGNDSPYHGGLYNFSSDDVTVANTIVAFNQSGIASIGNAKLEHNCVHGNTAYDYWGVPDPGGTNGNISADPLFADATNGDYRLQAGSPCIDAGDNAAVPADVFDLDQDGDTAEPLPLDLSGRARFVDDPFAADCPWTPGMCGTAPVVDMGAYERQRNGDCDLDWIIDIGDAAALEACMSGPAGAIELGCACGDLDSDGDIDLADVAALQQAFEE